MTTKANAIQSLRPGAEWMLNGDNLEWHDKNQTQPTESEIAAEIIRLQEKYNAEEYKRQRAKEYPSFADQFDLLYHGGMEAWKAAIDEVKARYPKP